VRSKRPIDHPLSLESLDCCRDRADPEPGRDERDRRLDVRNTAADTRDEPGSTAECDDLIVEGRGVVGRNDDEQLRRKIRCVRGSTACEQVIARQGDDNRFSPDCLIAETRVGTSGRMKPTSIRLSTNACRCCTDLRFWSLRSTSGKRFRNIRITSGSGSHDAEVT
jgi:hypothetical protein